MGIIKEEDLIAWKDGDDYYCDVCECIIDGCDPVTKGYFNENEIPRKEYTNKGDVVTCLGCGERIL